MMHSDWIALSVRISLRGHFSIEFGELNRPCQQARLSASVPVSMRAYRPAVFQSPAVTFRTSVSLMVSASVVSTYLCSAPVCIFVPLDEISLAVLSLSMLSLSVFSLSVFSLSAISLTETPVLIASLIGSPFQSNLPHSRRFIS